MKQKPQDSDPRKLILLSNDDGIDAPGLSALYDAVAHLGEILVVAPQGQRSAVSHAVTVHREMDYKVVERDGVLWGHALNAMPADCVKLGVLALAGRKPDLVIAGINPGGNIGNNILYSGTVAAAREGAMLGVPSIAVSLGYVQADPDMHFRTAQQAISRLAPIILERGLPTGVILNVNVPNVPPDGITGTLVTRQGRAMFVDDLQHAIDAGDVLTWRNIGKFTILEGKEGEDYDDVALREKKVSITPLHFDLTVHEFRAELGEWLASE
ncbi:5'/3'-nucleotidase SurE [bacterium]|nr:5'/3'-nucleotidase SurE [bacterium]